MCIESLKDFPSGYSFQSKACNTLARRVLSLNDCCESTFSRTPVFECNFPRTCETALSSRPFLSFTTSFIVLTLPPISHHSVERFLFVLAANGRRDHHLVKEIEQEDAIPRQVDVF